MITFFHTSSWWYFNLSGDSGNMNKTIVKIMGTINWVFTWSKQFRWFPKKNAMIIPKLYDGSYNEFKAPRTLNLIKSNRYHMSAILSHTNIFLSETIDFTYRLIYHLRMMEFQQLVRHRQFLREFSLHTNNKHFAPKSKVVNLAKIVKKNLGFNCWIFFHINAHNWRQTKQMNRSFYTKQLAQWQNSEVTCHRNVVNLFHFINKFRFLFFHLPMKPPTFTSDTTSDASSKVNGPVANVLFSLCSSRKFIVAHPLDEPNDNVSRLPILSIFH